MFGFLKPTCTVINALSKDWRLGKKHVCRFHQKTTKSSGRTRNQSRFWVINSYEKSRFSQAMWVIFSGFWRSTLPWPSALWHWLWPSWSVCGCESSRSWWCFMIRKCDGSVSIASMVLINIIWWYFFGIRTYHTNHPPIWVPRMNRWNAKPGFLLELFDFQGDYIFSREPPGTESWVVELFIAKMAYLGGVERYEMSMKCGFQCWCHGIQGYPPKDSQRYRL